MLIVHHGDFVMRTTKVHHGANKILATGAIEPCGTYNEIARTKLFYRLLASKLGNAISGIGICGGILWLA